MDSLEIVRQAAELAVERLSVENEETYECLLGKLEAEIKVCIAEEMLEGKYD